MTISISAWQAAELARQILDSDVRLSRREEGFLRDVANALDAPTPRQVAWLGDLWQRTNALRGRGPGR